MATSFSTLLCRSPCERPRASRSTGKQALGATLCAFVLDRSLLRVATRIHRSHIVRRVFTSTPERYCVVDVDIGLQRRPATKRAFPPLLKSDLFLQERGEVSSILPRPIPPRHPGSEHSVRLDLVVALEEELAVLQ